MASKARPNRWDYWVTGTGQVPFDMLRRDCAWPADMEAAGRMAEAGDVDLRREVRAIELCAVKPPTIERWASFGWIVSQVTPYHV